MRVSYVSADELGSVDHHQVLALVNYGAEAGNHSEFLTVNINMKQLGDTGQLEIWQSLKPVTSGTHENIHYRENEEVLFGVWRSSAAYESLKQETREAYRQLRRFLDKSGHPHLLRVWNYMPAINSEENGLERYRSFCLGRHDALLNEGKYSEEGLPAASALGSDKGHLVLYFISSKHPGQAVENPRQVSAYRYPEQYGPRSPSFSRAMKVGQNMQDIFISGTASIQGHETRHSDNVEKQFQETVFNINTLIKESHCKPVAMQDLSVLKIYLRNENDYARIKDLVSAIAPHTPAIYLKADICRTDLLLEIEGLYLSS